MKFFVDFEAAQTTEYIISIGCIAENGNKFSSYVRLPNPTDKVGRDITRLTGITDEMLEEAPCADVAFTDFWLWILEQNNKEEPQYYFYGNSDRRFLNNTKNTMSSTLAITFILSILQNYVDYSNFVKNKFSISGIKLLKLYNFVNENTASQRHDALEDAQMLKTVVENFNYITEENIESAQVQKQTPKVKKKVNPDFICSNFVNSKKCPPIFHEWTDKLEANTRGSENNWKIKASFGPYTKYFDCIDTAVIYTIKYLSHGKGSCKDRTYVEGVAKKIYNSVATGVKYAGTVWEYNGEI